MFRNWPFELYSISLNNSIQNIGRSGLSLTISTVAAMYEHRRRRHSVCLLRHNRIFP